MLDGIYFTIELRNGAGGIVRPFSRPLATRNNGFNEALREAVIRLYIRFDSGPSSMVGAAPS